MLVLTRKLNETVQIDDDVTITVVRINGDTVRLGIEAPKDLAVHRGEVLEAIRRQAAERARNQPNG